MDFFLSFNNSFPSYNSSIVSWTVFFPQQELKSLIVTPRKKFSPFGIHHDKGEEMVLVKILLASFGSGYTTSRRDVDGELGSACSTLLAWVVKNLHLKFTRKKTKNKNTEFVHTIESCAMTMSTMYC